MDIPTYVKDFHDEVEIKKMKYNELGNTGMVVSHIGIGGCSAGGEYGEVTEEMVRETISTAIRRGINYVDTSPGYGDGRSERLIGKALKELPRKSFYIATKVGRYTDDWSTMFDFSRERTKKSVLDSLERFGVEYIDLVQVHDLEFASDINIVIEETLPTLYELVKEGKIRHIGITGYQLHTLSLVLDLSTVPISTVLTYCRYNLANRDLHKFLPFFKTKEVAVINASLTGMRLLTSDGPSSWHPGSQEIKNAAIQAAAICKTEGVELGDLAVKYSLSLPGIPLSILGCDSKEILLRNIEMTRKPPTATERQLISKVQRVFMSLSQTHWEGVEIQEYKEALLKAEEERSEFESQPTSV